ncbi:MAG TPA: hypothetical protein VF499_05730, partial [Afipia sp.]
MSGAAIISMPSGPMSIRCFSMVMSDTAGGGVTPVSLISMRTFLPTGTSAFTASNAGALCASAWLAAMAMTAMPSSMVRINADRYFIVILKMFVDRRVRTQSARAFATGRRASCHANRQQHHFKGSGNRRAVERTGAGCVQRLRFGKDNNLRAHDAHRRYDKGSFKAGVHMAAGCAGVIPDTKAFVFFALV